MAIKTGRQVLASSLFLSRVLPLTTGAYLLGSMSPCFAHGNAHDAARGLGHHDGARQVGLANQANLNMVQNGFTEAFNAHVQRQTTGIDTGRFDLDLSSSAKNIDLGSQLFGRTSSVTIIADGAQETFKAGDQVTAAQYVAIQQVLSNSPQSISVSAAGTASGGTFSLNQAAASHVNNLLIPQSVSAIDNFATSRSVNLAGDLTNLGSIYGLSNNSHVRSGVISADDINNSGKITTDLSNSFLSTNGTVKNVDLTVVAEHNLTNTGSITSSGALTVATASGAVNNSGSITAQNGDLYLFAGNGNLVNSGVISALAGNVNIAASQIASDLNINATGGSFSASNDINIRDTSYVGSDATNLIGGDYLSRNLNVYGGTGNIFGNVGQVTGQLNTSGDGAHFYTQSDSLTLGSNCLLGDPTYANATGSITINGPVVAADNITILAAGSIIATGNAYISTADASGAAATPQTNITLVAGATVTNPGANSATLPGAAIGGATNATVDFSAGSGGNIDFSKATFAGALINSSSTLTGNVNDQKNGGNVILAAFASPTNSTTNGLILFPTGRPSINTSSLYGAAGTVTIIAGGNATTSKTPTIRVGTINSQADPVQGGASGAVTLAAAQPAASTGTVVTYNPAGGKVGAPTIIAGAPSNGTISLTGSILAGAANVSITTNAAGGGGITQTGVGRVEGNNVTLTAGLLGIGGTTTKSSLLTNAGTLFLTSGANIFLNNLGSVTLGNGATSTIAGPNGIVAISTTPDGSGNGRITVANNIAASSGILAAIDLTSSELLAFTGGIRNTAGTLTALSYNFQDGANGLGTGSIGGGAGTPINIVGGPTTTVSANTAGSVFLAPTGPIIVNDSSAGNGNTFSVVTTPDATNKGSITITGDVKAAVGQIGTITLTSSENGLAGGGGIIPGGTLTAGTVNLSDNNTATPGNGDGLSDIGNPGAAIKVLADTVTVTTNGNVNILDSVTTGMNLGKSHAGTTTQTFQVTCASGINVTNNVSSGQSITLISGGKAPFNDMVIGGNLSTTSATGTITLLSAGQIITNGTLATGQTVTETASSNIIINNTIDTTAATGTMTFTAGAGIASTGGSDVTSGQAITMIAKGKGAAGDVIIGSVINATAAGGKLAITSGGNITRNGGNGSNVAADNIVLTASGGIGTDFRPLFTGGNGVGAVGVNLTSNAPGLTNIYNQDTNPLILIGTTAKNHFTLTSDGAITTNVFITSATAIKIASTGSGTAGTNFLNILGNLGGKSTSTVELDTADKSNISTAAGVVLTAKANVTLSSGGGNIGSAGTPIKVSSPTLAASTLGGTGAVNLTTVASKKVPTVLLNSASDGDFNLNALGSITLTNLVTVDGSILVTSVGTLLSTAPNSIVQVGEPGTPAPGARTITLQDTSTKGSIVIGDGSTIQTFVNTPGVGSGTVKFIVGAGGGTTTNTPPAGINLTLNGTGSALFPTAGITVVGVNNNFTATNTNILIDTSNLPASHFTLGNNVTVTADPPPMQGGTVVASSGASVPTVVDAGLEAHARPLLDNSGFVQITSATSSIAPSLQSPQLSSTDSGVNSFGNLAAAQTTVQMALDLAPQLEKSVWLSDTELTNGEIPATVLSDGNIHVNSDEVSVADLKVSPIGMAPSAVRTQKVGLPLVGGVSKSFGTGQEATLNRGTVVVAPVVDTVINTPVGQIKIGAKSLALVMAFADGLAIYDLDDVRKGAIEVTAGGHSITLSPGQHIFVTNRNAHSFDEVNPAQMIGYRGITSRELNNGFKVFSAEFSVPQAVHAVKPLKHLVQSNQPQDRKVAAHLLKTTAAIMQLRGNSGAYQQVFRPRKTAWAQ